MRRSVPPHVIDIKSRIDLAKISEKINRLMDAREHLCNLEKMAVTTAGKLEVRDAIYSVNKQLDDLDRIWLAICPEGPHESCLGRVKDEDSSDAQ